MSPGAYVRGGVTLVRIQNSLEAAVVVLCFFESLSGYLGDSLSVFSISGYILNCVVSFIYSNVRGVLGNLSAESGRDGGESQAVLPGLHSIRCDLCSEPLPMKKLCIVCLIKVSHWATWRGYESELNIHPEKCAVIKEQALGSFFVVVYMIRHDNTLYQIAIPMFTCGFVSK